jgi:putative transposase
MMNAKSTSVAVAFTPGRIIRWHGRRFVVVDCDGLDSIVARQVGKRRLNRIPVDEVLPDGPIPSLSGSQFNLVGVPEEQWQAASKRFSILKPLLEMDRAKRTRAQVEKAAKVLKKHPSTIYRWINAYNRSGRVSVFLPTGRSDRGKSRLSHKVNAIIETAINKVYLTAEQPPVTAVIEEVQLQCFKAKIKRPNASTVRRRVAALSDRLKLEKRRSKKVAAQKYEPIKGHFPGADAPLTVAQIDHTPMDIIVVDEEHRQPIQRPSLTVVIDVYSRMVLGFAIYLEKPSAFTAGQAIAHAVLPKERWLKEVGVTADWPCWGKMRKIHCDNAKEFRGTVIGRACHDHDIVVEHRPPREPHYGGHIERGFRTWLTRTHRLKGTTFSNVKDKGEYQSARRATMTRAELEKWFTIYVAKVYANQFHHGINTTPLAKYKEGLVGTANRPGCGLPQRIIESDAFLLDFMPFEERTIQGYGVLIDHIYFWDDALRPWMHSLDPDDPKRPRKFVFRINPRDMREVYFWDPSDKTYIAIPYRDRSRPPTSRWEIQAAVKRLKSEGYARVDEVLIFQAIEEMHRLEQESEHKTKQARRARELRHRPPRHPSAPSVKPDATKASPNADTIPGTDRYVDRVEAFEGIVEPD